MLYSFIKFLADDINEFICSKIGTTGSFVLCTNLNNITDNNNSVDKKIIISIVNIEEEKLLQRQENFVRKSNTEIDYKQPPVWLNVICLFTYFNRSSENYEGIDQLANVVQYFQTNPRLDKTTAVIPANFPNELEVIRAEFVSLNYEQTNYLWGLFGGKYHPSVIYKFKTVPIDNNHVSSSGPAITETDVSALHKKDD